MSNDLAVATVTATLSEQLRLAVEADVSGAGISMTRPDQLESITTPGVNIFLYQVTPNPAYRNDDLPTRRSDGTVVERPQVALDLHYLLTFYGDEASLEPQRVLGSVVRTLHARPLLTRRAIRDTIDNVTSFPYLQGSDLAEQIERVKFTPISLNLEELSKLWSVFFQTAYRLSVAYIGNLVLIDANDNPQQALPVQNRNVYVRPFRQPVIEKLSTIEGDNEPITSSSTLVIEGRRLRGDITRVRIGEAVYEPDRENLGNTRISLDLSSATPVHGAQQAGLQGLQVIHRLMMGTPETEHEGVESNVEAIVLRPSIHQTGPGVFDYSIQLSAPQTDPDGTVFRTMTIRLAPDIGTRQRAVLILNEFNSSDPDGYSFLANTRTAVSNEVTFSIPENAVNSGDYLVRVQVDGAQSLLQRDTNAVSPTFNQYIRPRFSMP
jgi:hypothetical protein